MLGSVAFVWSDRALFIGDRSATAAHAHNAVEVSLALDDRGVHVGVTGGPELRGAAGVIVRADAEHRLVVPGPKVAVLYLDPRGPWGAAIDGALDDDLSRALDPAGAAEHAAAVRALLDPRVTIERAGAACDALLSSIADAPARPRVDPRVTRAIAFIDARLARAPTLAEVADHVGLSSSRTAHLFKAQVGLPLRRYVLWMRLRAALTEALATGNLTSAAHAAGFSDAAHFARTCKRTFGLPASEFAPVDRVLVSA